MTDNEDSLKKNKGLGNLYRYVPQLNLYRFYIYIDFDGKTQAEILLMCLGFAI